MSVEKDLCRLIPHENNRLATDDVKLVALRPSPPLSRQTSSSSCPPGLRYRNLGKSGLRVPNVALGAWVSFASQLSEEAAEEIVTAAYENGINLFDTADIYAGGRSEAMLGKILRKKGWKRSSYMVATKLFWGGNKPESEKGLSRKCILEGVQSCLDRLQLDYVDILYINKADPMCPMEEVVRACTFLINSGRVMYWGSSRWTAMEVMEAYTVARQCNLVPPTVEQTEYHMFQREKVEIQLPELFHKIGVGTVTWSPQAFGILAGKLDEGVHLLSRGSVKSMTMLQERSLAHDRQPSKLQELVHVAHRLGCSPTQLTIAWCLKNEHVHCVLLGATSLEQLASQLQALQIVPKLTSAVTAELEKILDNKPIRTLPTSR